jgi:hypothetical protein
MMFAYAKDLEAHLIGQGCLFDQVPKSFGAGDCFASVRIWEDFREIINAYFHANIPFTGFRSLASVHWRPFVGLPITNPPGGAGIPIPDPSNLTG